MRPRLSKIIICLLLCFAMMDLSMSKAADVSDEYAVKVAFIYNFTKFIDWPDTAFSSPDAPFVFGICGDNPFGNSLKYLKDKTVRKHPIEVRQINDLHTAADIHILFLCASEKSRFEEIFKLIDSPVLTIGDTEGFIEAGGIINLVTVNKKIRFRINQQAAALSKLKISSHLLNLAIGLR